MTPCRFVAWAVAVGRFCGLPTSPFPQRLAHPPGCSLFVQNAAPDLLCVFKYKKEGKKERKKDAVRDQESNLRRSAPSRGGSRTIIVTRPIRQLCVFVKVGFLQADPSYSESLAVRDGRLDVFWVATLCVLILIFICTFYMQSCSYSAIFYTSIGV